MLCPETVPGYDNALAESIIGLYKTEVVRHRGPWRSLENLELATLEWVDWFNHRRLLHRNGRIPPAEAEDAYYRQHHRGLQFPTQTKQPARTSQGGSSHTGREAPWAAFRRVVASPPSGEPDRNTAAGGPGNPGSALGHPVYAAGWF